MKNSLYKILNCKFWRKCLPKNKKIGQQQISQSNELDHRRQNVDSVLPLTILGEPLIWVAYLAWTVHRISIAGLVIIGTAISIPNVVSYCCQWCANRRNLKRWAEWDYVSIGHIALAICETCLVHTLWFFRTNHIFILSTPACKRIVSLVEICLR